MSDDFEEYAKTAYLLKAKNIRVRAKRKWSKEFTKNEYEGFLIQLKKCAKIASKYNLNICFENHRKSFTDNRYSTLMLMKEMKNNNVFTYWQPQAYENESQRAETIKFLEKYIKSVHVFNRDENFNRFPLANAKNEWKKYIRYLGKDVNYLLEFVKDDDLTQFYEDANCLKKLLA